MGAGCRMSAIRLDGRWPDGEPVIDAWVMQLVREPALTLACHLEDDPPVEPGAQEADA